MIPHFSASATVDKKSVGINKNVVATILDHMIRKPINQARNAVDVYW